MKLNKALILAGTALAGLAVTTVAMAQSTATQELETTVVVKGGKKSAAGVGVEQTVTKTRASITDEYLEARGPGSPLEALNILPGVNFTDYDATGSVGFDITLRGFDSQRIALILDGMPLNDTGNYAIYPTMNLDGELYSRVDVNLGSTDVDSPTAAAGGGTVNFVTKKPADQFGVEGKYSIGDNDYSRSFFRVDSGKFGPWGTRAFLTYSNLFSDKWKGYGAVKRQQWNGGLYQPLDNGDFVSMAFTYNKSRNNSYYNESAAEYAANYATDYAQTISSNSSTATGSSSGAFYGWKINPTNNGNIRVQSKFHLRDNLVLTVDPSFQYTLANGGTQVYLLNEKTGAIGSQIFTQLVNYDANKDGVIGSEYVFYPSLTRTLRYTLNTSLIWYINDNNTFRIAYTYDRGNHRQTGPASFLTADNNIADVFSRDDAYALTDAQGLRIERRNRQSYATLNQVALSYSGSFFDNKMKLDLGLRMPDFKRDLNQYCYMSGTNAYCEPTLAKSQSGIAATSWKVDYSKTLPNAGVSFKIDNHQTLYTSYSEMISAPRTDSLYNYPIPNLHPEDSQTEEFGYRYSSPLLSASASVWKSDFQHRIETGYDVDLGASVATDVGNARMNGANAEIGVRPLKGLSLYASASFTNTKMLNDYQFKAGSDLCGTAQAGSSKNAYDCTAGMHLGKIPARMYSFNGDYEIGNWQFGLDGKFTGQRYASLANGDYTKSFIVWNADVRYKIGKMGPLKESYLQLNAKNLFSEHYKSTIYAGNAFYDSGNYYYPGQPRFVMLTLDTKF